MNVVRTRTCLLAWIVRQWELLNALATLWWAELNFQEAAHYGTSPRRLAQMDRDIHDLRKRIASLRSS